ncbi:MAG: hypothetical protein LR008_01070 [Candidatus Pacebacteria bacterium]|nr:hypothetical protein [Candidatus Paceibacterota bacterium]
MQKVRLLVHATDVDAALNSIQKTGAFEFKEVEVENTSAPQLEFPHAQLLPRVQHALGFLEPYAPKVKLWKSLREGTRVEMTEDDVSEKLADTAIIAEIVEDLERLQVEFADKNEELRTLTVQRELLVKWKALPIKLAALKTGLTNTVLVESEQATETEPLAGYLSEIFTTEELPNQLTVVSDNLAAVTVRSEDLSKLQQLLNASTTEESAAPTGVETAEVEITAAEQALSTAKGELALLHDQAEHFSITHVRALRIASEILAWQRERFAVVESAVATKSSVLFTGWINKNKRNQIESEFKSGDIAATMFDIETEEDEAPPVEIQNSAFIQPFEAITRLYGMPGHRDLDPTVFLAGFFFLFFGLSLTDVGYGVFLMGVAIMVLTMFKVSNEIRVFAKLLLFMGLGSALVGLLFGGYLGISPEALPDFLLAIQLFDPIGDPLPVFYLALSLGVVQVMTGMVIKIYSDYKNDKLMEGILDQGPWLLMFMIGILYLLTSIGYVDILPLANITNLIYVGIALIIMASGRKGETVLQKVQSAALSLYNSIGYFSDILSYSRLLALGLATTALAFAVNLIAEIVAESIPYVGTVISIVVLVVGHLFTLMVNTLGAFIHSARLQFVEFFGKFIAGTGKQFAPLSRTEKYVTVGDD